MQNTKFKKVKGFESAAVFHMRNRRADLPTGGDGQPARQKQISAIPMTDQEIDNHLRATLVDEPVAFSFKQEVWRRIRSCDPRMPAGVLRFQPVAAVIGLTASGRRIQAVEPSEAMAPTERRPGDLDDQNE